MNRSQITVALCREHLQSIREIQEEERKRSPIGVAPTLNAIARALVAKGLESVKRGG